MSERFWESGAAVEPQPQVEVREPQAEPGSLAVSAGEFSALEERILRAVELVKREREQRASAETRASQAESRVAQAESRASQAESRVALAEALATHAEERAAQAEERATQAEMRATQAEAQFHEQAPAAERLQSELIALKGERDHVRQRVERLLQQMEGLEL